MLLSASTQPVLHGREDERRRGLGESKRRHELFQPHQQVRRQRRASLPVCTIAPVGIMHHSKMGSDEEVLSELQRCWYQHRLCRQGPFEDGAIGDVFSDREIMELMWYVARGQKLKACDKAATDPNSTSPKEGKGGTEDTAQRERFRHIQQQQRQQNESVATSTHRRSSLPLIAVVRPSIRVPTLKARSSNMGPLGVCVSPTSLHNKAIFNLNKHIPLLSSSPLTRQRSRRGSAAAQIHSPNRVRAFYYQMDEDTREELHEWMKTTEFAKAAMGVGMHPPSAV